jgi:predicted ATPase
MKYLEIKNYRGFDKGFFNFGIENFFIGDNNTGKSSILKLIKSLFTNKCLDFRGTYLADNQISDLKKDINEPIEFLYSFRRDNNRVHVNNKDDESVDSFEYLMVDSVPDYNYPLIKKFVTRSLKRDEICLFEIDYSFVNREIKVRNVSIYEYKTDLDFGDFKDGKSIDNIKEILNGSEKEKIYSSSFEDEISENSKFTFMKFLMNHTSENKFKLDLLLGFYQYSIDLPTNDDEGKEFLSINITRTFSHRYDIKYIDPLRPIFKEIYTKHELQIDHNLKYILDLYSNNKLLNKVNGFLSSSKMLNKIDIQMSNVMNSEIYVPMYDNNYKLSISGTGVSQVAPILYELYSRESDKLFIEQPEIHLHPRAQAEFGSVLFDYLKKSGDTRSSRIGLYRKQLFIETHSIYILDRLRSDLKKNKSISKDGNNSISIFFLENDKNNLITSHNIFITDSGKYNGNIKGFLSFFIDESIKNLSE